MQTRSRTTVLPPAKAVAIATGKAKTPPKQVPVLQTKEKRGGKGPTPSPRTGGKGKPEGKPAPQTRSVKEAKKVKGAKKPAEEETVDDVLLGEEEGAAEGEEDEEEEGGRGQSEAADAVMEDEFEPLRTALVVTIKKFVSVLRPPEGQEWNRSATIKTLSKIVAPVAAHNFQNPTDFKAVMMGVRIHFFLLSFLSLCLHKLTIFYIIVLHFDSRSCHSRYQGRILLFFAGPESQQVA